MPDPLYTNGSFIRLPTGGIGRIVGVNTNTDPITYSVAVQVEVAQDFTEDNLSPTE